MGRSTRDRDDSSEQPSKKSKKANKRKNRSKLIDGSSSGTPTPPGKAGKKKAKTKFKHFRTHKSIVQKLKAEGKSKMFEIQRECFDAVFDGKDVLARAHTGSGKTLAFAVPIVSRLLNEGTSTKPGEGIRVLCLAPTRELAMQVESVFQNIAGHLSTFCIYGGSAYGPQLDALRSGLDVLVGTCGRVKDLLSTQRIRLDRCKHVILDEADQMLDIGFAEDIEEILGYFSEIEAADRQIVLFSATIPNWVKSIAKQYMRGDPVVVDLTQGDVNKSSGTITHQCLMCHYQERAKVLGDMLLTKVGPKDRVIVFADKKVECNELAMTEFIKQECQVLHGDIAQKQRETTTEGFRQGRFPILIATDVAARGLDITGVQLVIHLTPPNAETYIHRSGRTGRAGQSGTSIVLFVPKEQYMITKIEKAVGIRFTRVGAPQAKDIAGGVSQEAMKLIAKIPREIRTLFTPYAEEAIGKSDLSTTELLAASFAVVSGYTKVSEDRSLLSSTPGYLTMQMKFDRSTEKYTIWNKLRFSFGNDSQKVRDLQMSKDSLIAVFDVPLKLADAFLEDSKIERCKQIPDLQEQYRPGGGRGRGRGRGRGGYGSYRRMSFRSRQSNGRARSPRSRGRGWGRKIRGRLSL